MYGELINALSQCRDVVIILHMSPDGDTIGSGLALWNALVRIGKRAAVVCQDEVPYIYRFLENSEIIRKPAEIDWTPDMAIAVDVADALRMGSARALFDRAGRGVCIDHHSTNSQPFAPLYYVDPSRGATCLLIYKLVLELGVPVDRMIAQSLYVGICTDTGNFNFSSTTPEALRVSADLIEGHGLDIVALTRMLFRLKRPQRLLLTARALGSLEFEFGGKISVMRLCEADFSDSGAERDDTEGLINMGIDCEGVALAILAHESPEGTKISFRSQSPVDVGELAASMGGGGHPRASGCTLDMPLDDAVRYVVGEAVKIFENT